MMNTIPRRCNDRGAAACCRALPPLRRGGLQASVARATPLSDALSTTSLTDGRADGRRSNHRGARREKL